MTISKSILEQITSLAFRGSVDSALQVLNESELNPAQKLKIAAILQEPLPAYTIEADQTLKGRISGVITKDSVVLNDTSATAPGINSTSVTDPNEKVSSSQITHIILNELPEDVMGVLFQICISQSDWKTLKTFPYVNKRWNQFATTFWEGFDLKQICPELTIIDAKAQDKKCDDEPKISKLAIIKSVMELAPHVEGNAGVTKLTMTKGTTLNQLIQIAKEAGITIHIAWDAILEELGDVPAGQTYVGLITNNVFNKSRSIAFELQKTLVEGHGCEMPTVQEYVALCVFANKMFQKCLYGQNPKTFGRSSTHSENLPLVVGNSTLSRIEVNDFNMAFEDFGAGGVRKF